MSYDGLVINYVKITIVKKIKILSYCRKHFVKIFTWALFPAFVALVGALAGFWSSLFSTELKEGLKQFLEHGFSGKFSSDACTGVVLVFAFFVLYALQQTAKNMQDEDARQSMLAETDKLKLLVERLETLPPDGFLQEFQALYKEVANLPLAPLLDEDTSSADIEQAIRTVLIAIASLAQKFDGKVESEKYVANLMLCKTNAQIQNLNSKDKADLESRLIFCPDLPVPKLGGLAAVLDLVPQLSSDFSGQLQNDAHIPSIALPVPERLDVDLGPTLGQRYTVLPGGPFVAALRQYAAFESIRALLSWCDNKADFTQSTILEINQFFHNGAGANIKSFISVPVCIITQKSAPPFDVFGGLPREIDTDRREDCLAVLNIHSKSEKILGASGYGMFVPIIEPFIHVLGLLLAVYEFRSAPTATQSAILKTDTESNHD